MGLNLPDPHIEQGTGQLHCFATDAHLPNLSGSLHWACLEQANIEVGVSNVLKSCFNCCGFLLTDSLVKTVWEFTSRNDIQLSGDITSPQLQHPGDECLMCVFTESNSFTKRQLIGMNRACLDLQVCSIADVSDSDGKCIKSWAEGSQKEPAQASRWRWPCEFPSHEDHTAWCKGLALL